MITPRSSERDLLLHENLIDLMSIMHTRLRLTRETFFLASNLFAKYMSLLASTSGTNATDYPSNAKLIVLVATSLFIAGKYQEIYAPPLCSYEKALSAYATVAGD
jgi:Cyclin, N-terminal domain